MSSYDEGKKEVCFWIRKYFKPSAKILDVGACDGKWRKLLPEYEIMDAVEVFKPNADNIQNLYRNVYCTDICKLNYPFYDLIIFGDIIEHLTVSDAQMVLRTAKKKCTDMIVAIPYLYEQGELYGNPYEIHIQADLTPEIFDKRYEGFEPLYQTQEYCYYHRSEK